MEEAAAAVDHDQLLLSLLYISLLIFATKTVGHYCARIGIPSVIGKIATGVVLGPAVLGVIQQTQLLQGFAELGVILLLFVAGLETNVETMRKNLNGSFLVGIFGVVTPLVLGWLVGSAYGYTHIQSIFIGTLLVATSVSISVQVLKEMNYLNSKEGVTVLGAAVIDDILGLVILTVVLGMAGAGVAEASQAGVIDLIWKIPTFFASVFLVGKFIVPRLLGWASKLRVSVPLYAMGMALAMFVGNRTDAMFGMEPIVGAYLMGVMLSLTPQKEELRHELENIAMSTFVPVFFGTIGLSVSFAGLGSYWGLFLVLMLVAVVSKLFACALGGRISGMNAKESWIVGAAMVSRGEVGLIVAAIGVQSQIISQDLYTVAVLISIATTLVTPFLLKILLSSAHNKSDHAPV